MLIISAEMSKLPMQQSRDLRDLSNLLKRLHATAKGYVNGLMPGDGMNRSKQKLSSLQTGRKGLPSSSGTRGKIRSVLDSVGDIPTGPRLT